MTKVLYIEDDEAMQRLYTYGLQQEGFSVEVANNAASALAALESPFTKEQARFDVILLDLMLPGMSGADFLRSAEPKLAQAHTKVVVLSNIDNPAVQERVKQFTSVVGYLKKSDYEPKQLADYIKQLVQAQ